MEEQEFNGGELNCGGSREPACISRWCWENQKKERGMFVSKTLKSTPAQPWHKKFQTCSIINMVLRAGIEPGYHQIVNGVLKGDL